MTKTRQQRLGLIALDALLLVCIFAIGTDKFLDDMRFRDMFEGARAGAQNLGTVLQSSVPALFVVYLVWAHTWRDLAGRNWSRFLPLFGIGNVVPIEVGVLIGVLIA